MTVLKKMSWACDLVAKMLLILKNYVFRYDRPTILYGVNLWLKPISTTAARMELPSVIVTLVTIRLGDIGAVWKAKVFQHYIAYQNPSLRPSEHVWWILIIYSQIHIKFINRGEWIPQIYL